MNTRMIASWLYQSWVAYLHSGIHIRLEQRSGDWKTHKVSFSSSLAFCPKKAAADRLGLLERDVWDERTHRMVEEGFRMGESVEEGIAFYAEQYNQVNEKLGNGKRIGFQNEVHMQNDFIAGTPDAIITVEGVNYPVEVKYTRAAHPIGFKWYQVVQLIAYMQLLQVKTGFLFTVYPLVEGQEPQHRVWIVEEDADGAGWYVLEQNGANVKTDLTYYPRTWDGTIYWSKSGFIDLVQEHLTWEKYIAANGLTDEIPSSIKGEQDVNCSTYVPAFVYQRASGDYKKGDTKIGTGTLTPKCGLFSTCYPGIKVQDGKAISK